MKNPRVVLCVCVIAVMSVSASAQQDSAPLTVPDLPDFNNHATPEISLGAPVRVVNPVLPKKLRKRDIVSVLETTIEQDGSLSDLNIAGGDQAFGELLLDAVRHWQYAPALVRGNPVKAPVFFDSYFARRQAELTTGNESILSDQPQNPSGRSDRGWCTFQD
jgi:hypothetical protein